MNYKVNEVYTLKVVGMIFDTHTDRNYIQVQDDDQILYNIKPYLWHLEWGGTPDTIDCVVTGFDNMGSPRFIIRKLDMLEKFYSIGETYIFNISSNKCFDSKTGNKFYEITDKVQDITQRYYTEEDYNEGDKIELKVSNIIETVTKNAYLKFEKIVDGNTSEITNKLGIDYETDADLQEARKKVGGCEGLHIEWKSSIAYVAGEIVPNIDKQLGVIMRVIASFQNSDGGTLYIGVNDNGQICGINQDFQFLNTGYDVIEMGFKYSQTLDSYQLKIHNTVVKRLGKSANSNIDIRFAKEGELYYCIIDVKPNKRPVYLDGNKLFQRAGNMIQMLTNEEMSNFIIDRSNFTPNAFPCSTPIQDPIVNIEQETAPITPSVNIIERKDSDIKFFMRFYEDGQWAYSKKKSTTLDYLIEFPIYKDTLKESLLLCYANGCITRISPYEFLNPKRSDNKRKYKKEDTRYSNGFYADSQLVGIYSCFNKDYIAIKCTDCEGTSYAKVHSIDAFTKYEAIQSKGKQAVPTGAVNISYTLIQSGQFHFVSALYLKNYLTTTSYGFKVKNIQLQSSIQNLDKLNRQEAIPH